MKKLNPARMLIALVVLFAFWQQGHFVTAKTEDAASNQRREAMPSLQGQPAIDYLKQRGLFESVRASIEADRHEIKWQARGWKATNPGQNLEATFSREGLMIAPGQSCDDASWQMTLKLRGVGYGEQLRNVVSGPMRTKGNRIEFQKLVSAGGQQTAITEWYANKREGIEQGFTIAEKPGVSFGIEPLRVALSVSGKLRARLEDGGQAITLAYENGRQALRYDHLVAYDALGRTLPSRMEANGGEISLLVDDMTAVYPVTIDPVFTQVKIITASDGAAFDVFGLSVAISGDTAIVGAYGDDSSKGSAYILERNTGGAEVWGEVKKLLASDGATQHRFGHTVAISGDTAIIGARIQGIATGSSSYVFERNQGGANNWGQVKKLTASDGSTNNQFGSSVGISGDTAIIGATLTGAAYVFERNQGGANNWGEVKKVTGSAATASNFFGAAASISGDTAVVGAYIGVTSAYVFERNQGGANNWGEVKKLTASDTISGDQYGFSVGISGDTIIIGANGHGTAYIYERNKGGANLWGEVKKLTISEVGVNFAYSVSISGDTAIVGAPFGDGQKGSAFVFERNTGGADQWGQVEKLIASDGVGGTSGDEFGTAVAISDDTVIIGAYHFNFSQGKAYIFATDCTWLEKRKAVAADGAAGDEFGGSVAISGDTAIVGASKADNASGAAYIFERNQAGADLWGEVKKLSTPDHGELGSSVAISGDTAIVGAPVQSGFEGAAYIFGRNQGGADNWGLVKKLTLTIPANLDSFGASVGISGDTALVGASGDDGKGSAWIFERNTGGVNNWGEVKKLIASDGVAGDAFGISVAISNDTAIVGASGADQSRGTAYIFERNTGGVANNWGEVAILTLAFDGSAGDEIGHSVAISDDTAVVGAPSDDASRGGAYIFQRNAFGVVNGWDAVTKVIASDGVADDRFGFSVSISGDTILIGADGDGLSRGAAYVFERNEGGADLWGEVKKLTALDGTPTDQFGIAVAISGDTAIVGASRNGLAVGSAHVFVCDPNPPANTPPTIVGETVSRTQGATGPVSTIANVGDSQDPLGSLTVILLTAPAGITVTGITNTDGEITANVAVACNAAPGDNPLQLRVEDSGLLTATDNLIVNVTEITLPPLTGGTAGTPYSQSAAASPPGTYLYSVSAGALPDGLLLNTSTGLVSGTPTVANTFNFTISAVGGGCPVSRSYSLEIACPPVITVSTLPTGATAGTAYSQTITASPVGTTYSFSHTGGQMPPGLTLSPTGLLSGTPTEAGTFGFQVTATGFGSCSGIRDYLIVISCPTTITLSALSGGGMVNAPYSQTITGAPAGTTYSFSHTGGQIPPGLILSPTGLLSGTPTQAGTFGFQVTANGFGICAGSKDYEIEIACALVTFNPSSLPGGSVGTPYSQSVSASPAGTYTYNVLGGTMPPGLNLHSGTGAITGTPTTQGSSTFTITAVAGTCSGSHTYTIVVGCPGITITTTTLPAGTSGSGYSQAINVSPAGSYTFSQTQGTLPSSLWLNSSTGVISGTAQTPGTYNFSVTAKLPNGCSATQQLSITINCPTITVNPATLPNGQIGTPYSQMLSALPSGGYTFAVAGTLPPGLALNATTGLLSGTPKANGAFTFTVNATGAFSCIGGRSYTVTIGLGACPAITLPPTLPAGKVGTLYMKYVTPTPAGTYTYSLTGSLPPGVTFYASMGLLYGYPTTAATYNFSVTATNVNNCTATKGYMVTIAQ